MIYQLQDDFDERFSRSCCPNHCYPIEKICVTCASNWDQALLCEKCHEENMVQNHANHPFIRWTDAIPGGLESRINFFLQSLRFKRGQEVLKHIDDLFIELKKAIIEEYDELHSGMKNMLSNIVKYDHTSENLQNIILEIKKEKEIIAIDTKTNKETRYQNYCIMIEKNVNQVDKILKEVNDINNNIDIWEKNIENEIKSFKKNFKDITQNLLNLDFKKILHSNSVNNCMNQSMKSIPKITIFNDKDIIAATKPMQLNDMSLTPRQSHANSTTLKTSQTLPSSQQLQKLHLEQQQQQSKLNLKASYDLTSAENQQKINRSSNKFLTIDTSSFDKTRRTLSNGIHNIQLPITTSTNLGSHSPSLGGGSGSSSGNGCSISRSPAITNPLTPRKTLTANSLDKNYYMSPTYIPTSRHNSQHVINNNGAKTPINKPKTPRNNTLNTIHGNENYHGLYNNKSFSQYINLDTCNDSMDRESLNSTIMTNVTANYPYNIYKPALNMVKKSLYKTSQASHAIAVIKCLSQASKFMQALEKFKKNGNELLSIFCSLNNPEFDTSSITQLDSIIEKFIENIESYPQSKISSTSTQSISTSTSTLIIPSIMTTTPTTTTAILPSMSPSISTLQSSSTMSSLLLDKDPSNFLTNLMNSLSLDFDKIFSGVITSTFKCMFCLHVAQVTTVLSIPVIVKMSKLAQNDPSSIFYNEEKQMNCTKCNTFIPFKTNESVIKLPEILILSIVQNNSDKLDKIKFKNELIFFPNSGNKTLYRVFSLILMKDNKFEGKIFIPMKKNSKDEYIEFDNTNDGHNGVMKWADIIANIAINIPIMLFCQRVNI